MITTYKFQIETYGITIDIVVEKVSTEYMRFLKELDRIENPMDKKTYGFNLIKKYLIIKRLTDGYSIGLPLLHHIVPTEKTLPSGAIPLTGTQLKAAKKSFRQFSQDKGIFKMGVQLPSIRFKVLSTITTN